MFNCCGFAVYSLWFSGSFCPGRLGGFAGSVEKHGFSSIFPGFYSVFIDRNCWLAYLLFGGFALFPQRLLQIKQVFKKKWLFL